MKLYEDTKYEMWKETVEQILPSLLKRNLLIKPAISQSLTAQHMPNPPEDTGGDVGEYDINITFTIGILFQGK